MDQTKHDHLLDAKGVNADLARKVKAVLADVRGHGKQVYITEVLRTKQRQRMLYAKGRSDSQLKEAGYTTAQITQARADARADGGLSTKKTVTGTLKSKHIEGLAADIVPINNGALDWDDLATFKLIASSAKAHGLVTGSKWAMRDYPHVQLGD